MNAAALWIYAGFIVLLPFNRAAEVAVIAAVLLAIAVLWRERAKLAGPAGRLAVILFLGYWLPTLLSAPDAVAGAKTWSSVAVFFRFAPFALLAVALLRVPELHRVWRVAAIVAAVWTVDALFQAVSGYSVGGRLLADRVSGMFGADNLKLGPALAVLTPFLFEYALARWGRIGFAAAWIAAALAVLLAGERAGWVAFAVVTACYAWRVARGARQLAAVTLVALLLAGALGGAAYYASERFAVRVDRTLALAHGDVAAIDYALAGRVPIWRTALVMGAAHPINGVGVRGFRHAYAEYARPDDPWVDPATGEGARHPHQLLLELWAELGVLGLIGWSVGAIAAWRAWRAADVAARELARPVAIALVAMCFPFNTHFAFYSNHWAIYLWWLLALYCAALAAREATEDGA